MDRKVLWPTLLIGAALVAAPFALSLPTKAIAGERMIRDFQPIMRAGSVKETARYYDEVFVPLGKVAPLMGEATVAKFSGYLEGFAGVQADAERLVPLLAGALGPASWRRNRPSAPRGRTPLEVLGCPAGRCRRPDRRRGSRPRFRHRRTET